MQLYARTNEQTREKKCVNQLKQTNWSHTLVKHIFNAARCCDELLNFQQKFSYVQRASVRRYIYAHCTFICYVTVHNSIDR